MKLAELTWPDVANLDRNIVVIYPIASLEQHSRHLPFSTDAILCNEVATRAEAVLKTDALLLPVQWLGASEHHLGMAGTLTVGNTAHHSIICEPIECLLKAGFRRIFILNGHGGNSDGFHLALRYLAQKFPEALLGGANYWDLCKEGIAKLLEGNLKQVGHACEFETSLMLHIRPDLVRKSEITDGKLMGTIAALPDIYIPLDMKRHTPNGGTGQPTLATADKGKSLLNLVVAKTVETIQLFKMA